VGPGECVLWW